MTEAEYVEFLDSAVVGYAEQKVKAGTWTQHEALGKSRETFAEMLPHGVTSPQNYLYTVRDTQTNDAVAVLWFALRGEEGRREAFVCEIEVHEEFRGKGYGRATMQACSEEARKVGAVSVGLHVFGHNTVARSLYTSLGFVETGVLMSLRLNEA